MQYSAGRLLQFCNDIIELGQVVSSRHGDTFELLMQQFSVDLEVLNACPVRKFNLGFALAEFASLVTGYDRIELFTRHIKNYAKFSSDGQRLDNSYGSRVAPHVQNLIHVLRDRPDSRYAVLTINDTGLHMLSDSLHVPCTLSIQFLVRGQKLHMHVSMRSNDAIKGVTTDVVVFSLFQMFIAEQLGLSVGMYKQTAGSLHVYASDLPLINVLPDSSPAFRIPPATFRNVELNDIATLAKALADRDCMTCPDLPDGLRSLFHAATYRWHRDLAAIEDLSMQLYCSARYSD